MIQEVRISLLVKFCLVFMAINLWCKEPFSQSKNEYVYKWHTVPGSPVVIYLDTKTPLTKLIQKLPIAKTMDTGYTKDMFSIAAYKRSAIRPLLVLFKNDTNSKTRESIIHTLYLIAIDNKLTERPWRDKQKLVEPEAKLALISLLNYNGYDAIISSILEEYCSKQDFLPLLKILKHRRIESIEYYNLLFNLYYDIHHDHFFSSRETDLVNEMPTNIDLTYYDVHGNIHQPYVERIALWIKQGKKLVVDSQIRATDEWKMLSFQGIYSDGEVLRRFLSEYYNPHASPPTKQTIFMNQINDEMYIYGVRLAREKWLRAFYK